MTHADLIFQLDKKYHWTQPDAISCPNEGVLYKSVIGKKSVHGHMAVHGSGKYLMCGTCDAQAPTGGI